MKKEWKHLDCWDEALKIRILGKHWRLNGNYPKDNTYFFEIRIQRSLDVLIQIRIFQCKIWVLSRTTWPIYDIHVEFEKSTKWIYKKLATQNFKNAIIAETILSIVRFEGYFLLKNRARLAQSHSFAQQQGVRKEWWGANLRIIECC